MEQDYTEVFTALASGTSVKTACTQLGLTWQTFFVHLSHSKELQDQYARARKIRADARFESADQVTEDMRAGIIDAAQARVEIDKIKWQCGKEAPAKYGERLELAGSLDTSKGWADILRERRAARAAKNTPETTS